MDVIEQLLSLCGNQGREAELCELFADYFETNTDCPGWVAAALTAAAARRDTKIIIGNTNRLEETFLTEAADLLGWSNDDYGEAFWIKVPTTSMTLQVSREGLDEQGRSCHICNVQLSS